MLTPEIIQAIEQILRKGKQVEIKIENGKPTVIEITRKKRI